MKSFANLSSVTFLLFFLASCAVAPDPAPQKSTGADVRLAAQMAGEYNRKSSPDGPLRDYRIAIAPLGAGEWIYYQVNEGDGLTQVYRQRVLNLRAQPDGRVLQTAYTLNAPDAYQGMGARLQQLTLDQLTRGMENGCDMVWVEMPNGWAGRVDPNSCVIVSNRRQTELRIGARADIVGDRLRQAETGYDLDGNRLWGSEDGEWMVLYRAEPAMN